jgi:tRNA-specific 2-thiouridylase
VRCNSLIKFKHLLGKAQELGAELLVTGHYAQIVQKNGIYHLLKGTDAAKDQSYFLYNLDQDQLAHIWFPLGELTKSKTRKIAEEYALKTAKKTESQDICFVTTSTQDFLSDKIKAKPGNILDKTGKILGKHEGLPFYTIGQRKGLGGGFTEPMYVVNINLSRYELVVGREEELYTSEMIVKDVTWTNEAPALPAEHNVKIRYNSAATPSSLRKSESDKIISVKFDKPQKAMTPGQTAVFYLGDEVVGGGIIEVPVKPAP